jgi:hypothetical protein
MVARPVAQSLTEDDLRRPDTGRAPAGSGVRPDQYRIEVPHRQFLQPGAARDCRAACLRQAHRGGHSRVASFHTLHNALLARHPECLARLYRPFWFDRQREFHDGEMPVFAAPVFTPKDHSVDELHARFSAHQIRGGYALKGEPLDAEGAAALAALLDLFDDDTLSADFDLEPGQLQFSDNRVLGHARTEFEDFPEPSAAATSSACGCATTPAAYAG